MTLLCETFLYETLVGTAARTRLWDTLVRHSRPTLL